MNGEAASPSDAASSPPPLFRFVDTHAHLDQEDYDADRAEVVARANAAGVGILCVAVSASTSDAVVHLADAFHFHAAVGIHPNCAADAVPGDWARVERLLEHPRVVALGETGLDRHWDYAPIALQQEYFARHLQLGRERDLPVIIHCREAEADLMPMLREAAARGPLRGVLHAFSGDRAMAAECIALGLHISFAGNVTHTNKKFETLRDAAKTIPDDRILIETDSPYLMPQVFRGKQKRNEPANVVHTAAFLAELRGCSLEHLAATTTANAQRLFHLR